jgi:hypothetical protein
VIKRPTKRERDEIERRKRKRDEIERRKRERDEIEWLAQTRRLSSYRERDRSPLIDLVFEIDRTLDPKLLLSLFDPPLTSEEIRHILPHLEDLFDRLTFKRTRNDRRPPSYMRTEQQHKLLQALDDVKHRPDGVKLAEAITDAAKKRGVNETALKLAVQGQHSSLRRQARRSRGHK